jgi:hypothetical protein
MIGPIMARPIEPTPPLTGEDAEQLLVSLEEVASEEEMARRVEEAKKYLAEMMRPKGARRPPGDPSQG